MPKEGYKLNKLRQSRDYLYDETVKLAAQRDKLTEALRRIRFYLGGHTGNEIAQDEGALRHNTEKALALVLQTLGERSAD